MLNREEDNSAVVIADSRTSEFEVVRPTHAWTVLRTVGHNKDHPKPIKIFEVGDVVLLDGTNDVGAVNRNHLAALYCGANWDLSTDFTTFVACTVYRLLHEKSESLHFFREDKPTLFTGESALEHSALCTLRSSRSLTFQIPAPFWSLTCRVSYSQSISYHALFSPGRLCRVGSIKYL
ncbi:hypothetical protein HAX54_042526 [Datura stramonium]|uniref:Phenylalanyl tRNA synthetase beta chain core domain-containing protein n=1 Tax=Datura stramonium TaxID=4076 RepID=A0ABS8W231_DATST|nr:hypothetical protein [Datura stramonium]